MPDKQEQQRTNSHAYYLASGQSFEWGLGTKTPLPQEAFWLHIDGTIADDMQWLESSGLIPGYFLQAFSHDNPRPLCEVTAEGILLIMRGINHNEGQDPEDMIAVRFWVTERYVISMSHRKSFVAQRLGQLLSVPNSIKKPMDLLAEFGKHALLEISALLVQVGDKLDLLEAQVLAPTEDPHDEELAAVSSTNLYLHRHLQPLKDAVQEMLDLESPLMKGPILMRARELLNRLKSCLEETDLVRQRLQLIEMQIDRHIARKTERRSYLFTMWATVILPVNMFTSLCGVNLAGIPFAKEPWAFGVFCLLLIASAFLVRLILKPYRYNQ